MLEMIVKQIGLNALDGQPVVVLQQKEGAMMLPIWIGPAELKSISLAFNHTVPPRPQTHDLFVNLFDVLDIKVERLEITELTEETFFARLYFKDAGCEEMKTLDCRPSDGIAIALRAGVPIMAAPHVVESAGFPDEQKKQEVESAQFKKFVGELKASDFLKFLEQKRVSVEEVPGAPEEDEAEKPGESDQ